MASTNTSMTARVAAGFAAAAVAALTVLGGGLPASAAPNVDAERVGSVTVHKYEQPAAEPALDNSGRQLTEAELTGLTPVNGVTFKLQWLSAVDVTTPAGWNTLASLDAADVIADPEQYALTNAQERTTAGSGVAKFSNLPLGAYLVQELVRTPVGGESNVVIPGAPFLVVVPQAADNDWIYDVHVYPKSSVASVTKTVQGFAPQGLGSTLTWTIESNAPIAAPSTSISSYVIEDTLDAAIGFVAGSVTVQVGTQELVSGKDFTVSTMPAAGGTLSITFEETGLDALRERAGEPVVATLTGTVKSLTATGALSNTARVIVNGTGIVQSSPVVDSWGGIEIKKTDDAATPVALRGAVFSVFATADTTFAHPIAINGATTWTSDANGIVTIHGLRTNATGDQAYVVREVQAPAGFQIPTTSSWTVAVPVGTNAAVELTVQNSQVPAYTLPITGGSGQAAFMIGGAGLLFGALGFALLRRRKADAEV